VIRNHEGIPHDDTPTASNAGSVAGGKPDEATRQDQDEGGNAAS
jgi:hypothetical protein